MTHIPTPPVLYVSATQLDNVCDPESATSGSYMPVRKTPGGKLTLPLYTHAVPSTAGAPVLDDRWKARMLDGRALERDAQGFGEHPDLPATDEDMHPPKFFESLGMQLVGRSAEDELDMDAYDTMSGTRDLEVYDFNGWTPSRPDGDGWCLVSIHDTEDGPVAWWLRKLPHGAIARSGRRVGERDDLTAEECREYLSSGWARVRGRAERALVLQLSELLDAGPAPAAVAPQGEYPPLPPALAYANRESLNGMQNMDFAEVEPLPSEHRSAGLYDADQMRAYFDLGRQQPATVAGPAWDKTRDSLAMLLLGLARNPNLSLDVACIALDSATEPGMPLADLRGAAPALEAPAAPARIYVEVCECSNCGHIGINDDDGSKAVCNNCYWQGDSPSEDKCPDCKKEGTMTSACPKCGSRTTLLADTYLAAAPQAPAQAIAHRMLRKNGSGEWVHDAKNWADGPAPAELIADVSKHPDLYRIEHAYSGVAPQAPAAPVDEQSARDSICAWSVWWTHNKAKFTTPRQSALAAWNHANERALRALAAPAAPAVSARPAAATATRS